MKQNDIISAQLLDDARQIIEAAQETAYRLADLTLVRRNWLLGQRISQEELGGADRANYGAETIIGLSQILTKEYGKGFTKTNLYTFVQFYKFFPNIFHTPCGKSTETGKQIFHTVSGKSQHHLSVVDNSTFAENLEPQFGQKLSWSHYRTLLQVHDKEARDWYAEEAKNQQVACRASWEGFHYCFKVVYE